MRIIPLITAVIINALEQSQQHSMLIITTFIPLVRTNIRACNCAMLHDARTFAESIAHIIA